MSRFLTVCTCLCALACAACVARQHTAVPIPTHPTSVVAGLTVTFYWAIGVSLAGIGASVAVGTLLASLMPRIVRYAIAAGLGFAAIFALSLLTVVLLPYLVWIAAALLVLLTVIVAINFKRLKAALIELATKHDPAISPTPLTDATKTITSHIKMRLLTAKV